MRCFCCLLSAVSKVYMCASPRRRHSHTHRPYKLQELPHSELIRQAGETLSSIIYSPSGPRGHVSPDNRQLIRNVFRLQEQDGAIIMLSEFYCGFLNPPLATFGRNPSPILPPSTNNS